MLGTESTAANAADLANSGLLRTCREAALTTCGTAGKPCPVKPNASNFFRKPSKRRPPHAYWQTNCAVPETLADVLFTPLLTVIVKFSGAVAVTVTVPGERHVASPVEPTLAAVVDVFHESPSACESSRLVPLLKVPSAVYPTCP